MRKILFIFILVISLIYIYPIVYTFTNSFMTEAQINTEGVHIIPDEFNIQQYYSLVTDKAEYFKLFMNSVKLTAVIILGQIVLGILQPLYLQR